MINIAKALVYSVSFINGRNKDMDEQNDVDALEMIKYYLDFCSAEELIVIKSAINTLIVEESNSELLSDYKKWFENMFGE